MKRLLFVLAVAVFVACNGGTTTEGKADSIENNMDSTKDAMIDSVQNSSDYVSKKIDSTFEANSDALKQQ